MEIVIKIPDEAYQRLLEEQHLPNRIDLEYFIVHSTPLPKGHGRLLQEQDVIKSLFDYVDGKKTIGQCVEDTKAIIEADKEQEE